MLKSNNNRPTKQSSRPLIASADYNRCAINETNQFEAHKAPYLILLVSDWDWGVSNPLAVKTKLLGMGLTSPLGRPGEDRR
jgi:hypothetical protein